MYQNHSHKILIILKCFKIVQTVSVSLIKVYEFLRDPRNHRLVVGDTCQAIDMHLSQPHFHEYSSRMRFFIVFYSL
jgi:tRNA(Ile2) C34 agmatinyltransferase TiaS